MRQPVTNYEAASRSGVIRQKREVCRLLRHKPAVNRRAEDGWVDGQRGGGMEGRVLESALFFLIKVKSRAELPSLRNPTDY